MMEKEARVMLDAVWAAGCRYFDTAPLYGLGLSETRLNGFLRPKPRGSYLISTKVGRLLDLCEPQKRSGQGMFFETPSRRERFDYSYDGVMRSFEESFERLGPTTWISFTATMSMSSPTEAGKPPTRGSRSL
jgi:D-threo-aldose 1-dehydrogenase